MPHHDEHIEPDMPHAPNGHKAYLKAIADEGHVNPVIVALAHLGLYLGHILEHLSYEVQRQGSRTATPAWYPPRQPDIHDE